MCEASASNDRPITVAWQTWTCASGMAPAALAAAISLATALVLLNLGLQFLGTLQRELAMQGERRRWVGDEAKAAGVTQVTAGKVGSSRILHSDLGRRSKLMGFDVFPVWLCWRRIGLLVFQIGPNHTNLMRICYPPF